MCLEKYISQEKKTVITLTNAFPLWGRRAGTLPSLKSDVATQITRPDVRPLFEAKYFSAFTISKTQETDACYEIIGNQSIEQKQEGDCKLCENMNVRGYSQPKKWSGWKSTVKLLRKCKANKELKKAPAVQASHHQQNLQTSLNQQLRGKWSLIISLP